MTQTIIKIPATGAFDPTDIEITDNTSGAFLIKEGSNEYMRINTTNGSEQMVLKGRPGSASNAMLYLSDQPFLQGTESQFIQMVGTGVNLETGQAANRLDVKIGNSGNSFRVVGTSNTERFKVLDDSNATFTLDSSSTCNFKVVDNAGSPITYIDVERGSTARVKIPVVGLETIRATGGAFVAGVSNTTGINLNTFPLNYANTLLTFDQTADGTTSNQSTKPGLTVVYSSSATGAATSSGITLQLGAGVPADGTTSPQCLVMHNQNATHSVKFILDGSGFYNGHEVATSGSDAADLIGSGFTLAAGKFAVFSILACRVTNTGDHYFYAVSLHTKT